MALDCSILAWLRCFDAAARHLSFTRAAGELNVSQGAVSQQIRNLEQRLHCKLFVRSTGGLEFTRQGARLADEISPALRAIEGSVRGIISAATPLQVSCSPSFAHRWLLPRLSEFVRSNPQVDVRLRAEFHAVNRANLLRDGIDVAIRYDPFEYHDLDAELLMDDFLYPVAGAESAWVRSDFNAVDRMSVTILQDACPWEGAAESAEWKALEPAVAREGIDAVSSRFFNLSDLALAAALAGDGIAIGRLSLMLEELRDGRLVRLTNEPVLAPARYMLISFGNGDPKVEKFCSWLRTKAAEFVAERMSFVPSLV